MPYCQVNGFVTHYSDSGKGETVLLLHAGGTSSKHWRKIAPLLEDRFRLVAPDLIGFGGTEPWSGSADLTHDDQADLVRGLAHWAASGPVHVVGHSYGGAVAVRLALKYPEMVKSLVLVEPVLTGLLDQKGEKALFEAERALAQAFITDAVAGEDVRAWCRFIDHHNGEGTWANLSEEAQERFLDMTRQTADAYRSNFNNPTTIGDLRGLQVPVALASGSETNETYSKICGILRASLPNCAAEEVDGAGHMSPLTHPQAIADVIEDHIEASGGVAAAGLHELRRAA